MEMIITQVVKIQNKYRFEGYVTRYDIHYMFLTTANRVRLWEWDPWISICIHWPRPRRLFCSPM